VSPRLVALYEQELSKHFDEHGTFVHFAAQVADHKRKLMSLLNELKDRGKRIAGYGASGRANTIIQYCGIGSRHLDYMIDDAPAKIGYCTPGSHLTIHPSSILGESVPPDYLLVFAWSFFDEIRKRNERYLASGGRMIIPLPEVSIFPPAR
jgi:hypothetical protein